VDTKLLASSVVLSFIELISKLVECDVSRWALQQEKCTGHIIITITVITKNYLSFFNYKQFVMKVTTTLKMF
jgi:hypothetical protein